MEEIKLTIYTTDRLDVRYKLDNDERRVDYAKVRIAVVKNPYTNELELAVQPMVRNQYNEYVPLYTFEDDIRYYHYMLLAGEYYLKNKAIPDDIDKYVREILDKKEIARKQADEYVRKELGLAPDDPSVSTGFTRNEWREAVINCVDAQKLLEEYKKNNPTN